MSIKRGELGIDIIVYAICALVLAVTLYPILYVFFMSISTPRAVYMNELSFLPDGIYLQSYKDILSKSEIWVYYYNTIWIVGFGTSINLILTLFTGYTLSRKDFKFRNYLMAFMVFTMFFSGGMIPFFIQVRKLGLVNSRWALVLPFALSAWNVIIARTYFQSAIPESLHEAAIIDGASKFQILTRIIMPLSKPILAVVALWCAVGFWNSYFWALVFLPNPAKQPIQVFLVKALIQHSSSQLTILLQGFETVEGMSVLEQMKYVIIVITILPILAVYPVLQKYFIKGVMIGSLKG
ncbi:MAG TPA: carbohydrate ABC transporter permease [bacterium]|nr:carbohydrate ABC transporter permease [bacterium]